MGRLQRHMGNTIVRYDVTNAHKSHHRNRIAPAILPVPWLGRYLCPAHLSLRICENLDIGGVAGDLPGAVCHVGDSLGSATQEPICGYLTKRFELVKS